ncbi:MAG TPA: hypothetical protein VMW24_24565 [Sedimentisphaerales bacterium]|nr:hypothetical protein [Sedimentisphaerales bacterium]
MSRTTEAITLLELELKEAEARVKTLRVAVETVRQLAPAAMDKTVIVGGQVAAALSAFRQPPVEPDPVPDPEPGVTGAEPAAKTSPTGNRRAGRKGGASQYFGVTRSKKVVSQPGAEQWKGQVRIGGKYCYLGQLSGQAGEIELAARVQEKLGNPVEAQRLRQKTIDMAEQIENNPDRPKPKHRKAKKAADLPPPSAHQWECNKCGRNYVKKPDACSCGGQVLVRINADGSGNWDMPERPAN